MPQATDLVLANGAPTPVQKTFKLMSPSAGDGSWCNWRLQEGTISTVFPALASCSRDNGPRTARKLDLKVRVPSSYTDAVTGLTVVNSNFTFDATVTCPNAFPEALKPDAIAFVSNFMAAALVKEMMKQMTSAS